MGEQLRARSQFDQHDRVYTEVDSRSATKQSFKDECDINRIMARYKATGILPLTSRQARYGDFSNVLEYQEACNAVIAADAAFMSLPAKVRSRFHNDPAELISFLSDPENREEAEKLGLVERSAPVSASAQASDNTAEKKSGQLPLDVTGRTDTEGAN